MGVLTAAAPATLRVRWDDDIAFVAFDRPEAGNAISDALIADLRTVLQDCETRAKIVVLEGSPEVFCLGADFGEIRGALSAGTTAGQDPAALYDLWLRLATGPYVSIAHVRGRANAGGVGFVAACDIVLAQDDATFALSELLFGLMPACVLPFLVRRIGFARANYLTLQTQPVTAAQARDWGLVDACEAVSENLLRKQLLRLRRLGKPAIARYKRYAAGLTDTLHASREAALAANREVFGDPANLQGIARYVETGRFPWDAGA